METNELPEEVKKQIYGALEKLPYTKHLDDGQFNDGQLSGFEQGAEFCYRLSQSLLQQRDEDLRKAHINNAYYIGRCGELEAEVKANDEEIAKLKSVMIAAAEEIQEHWQAHCDAEGYGPSNLMHRLEQGIPAQYGYTAGAFEKQGKLIQRLTSEVERLKDENNKLRFASLDPSETGSSSKLEPTK